MEKPGKEKLQALLKEYSLIPDYGSQEVKDVNTASPVGVYPIHYAASRGNVEEVQILLEFGADINTRGEYGFTPLHYAVMQGFVEMVEFLLVRGADPSVRNDDGNTALELAGVMGEEDVEVFLLEDQTNINFIDEEDGSTLLHRSAGEGHITTVQYLLGRGADINCKDKDGFTPLHCAVEEEQEEMIQFLMTQGADTSAKNQDGDTPLDIARVLGLEEIKGILSGKD
jgi:ankyrin repeat protein